MNSSLLLQRFLAFIQSGNLFNSGNRLLLAVSGGLDSAVLCHLCHSAQFSFTIAHCNFGLRGAESDRDEAFVLQLGEKYGIPVLVKHFDTLSFAEAQKLSIQEAARKLRYDWFDDLLKTGVPGIQKNEGVTGQYIRTPDSELQTPDLLLTAHHLDDNIETVVMNFFKGTGISGLRGMQPKKGQVVRPLLFARRSELEAYAQENGLQWVEDSSNQETKYTRNFFRHKVLPLVEEKVPHAAENVGAAIERFSEVELLYKQALEEHKKKLLQFRGNEVYIPVLKLAKTVPLHTIVYEIIRQYGFSPAQTPEVVRLLQSETGRFVRSATHQILRHRRWLVIAPLQSLAQTLQVIEEGEEQVHYQGCTMHIKHTGVPQQLKTDPSIALLDAGELRFPLVLRRWRAGDYFYPLGMPKKKKVSRFLIDLKLSKTDKENVWVLESGKRIAWVVGLRIDDRFKIGTNTNAVVRITSSPSTEDTSARRG